MSFVTDLARQDALDRVIEQRLQRADFLKRHPEWAVPVTNDNPQGEQQCDEPCSSSE